MYLPCSAAPRHTRRFTPCTLTRRTATHTPGHTVYPDAPSRRTSPCCAIPRMLPCHAALHLCRTPHTESNHAPLPRPAHRAQPRTFAAPRRPAHSRYITRPRDVLRLAFAFAVRRSTHIAMPRRTTPRPLAHITLATFHLPPCVYPSHRPRYFSPPALRIPTASPPRTLCLVSSYRARTTPLHLPHHAR